MNRDEASGSLQSSVIATRLEAARFFSRDAEQADLVLLQKALKNESVPWVRRALERAIARCEVTEHSIGSEGGRVVPGEPNEALVRDLRSEAVEEVAGTILHEFAAIIGVLRISAKEEVRNFESSETRKRLDQLVDLIDAVRNLKKAAAVPTYSQFDLAQLVDDTTHSFTDIGRVSVRSGGTRPFLTMADRGSLALALLNGLRNAVEAVSMLEPPHRREIDINWGRGGAEDWLVIVDNGSGFTGEPADALRLGVTNKMDHIGYGLATAQHAMRSMEGDVLLSNAPGRGARFELRWYKDHANSIRRR